MAWNSIIFYWTPLSVNELHYHLVLYYLFLNILSVIKLYYLVVNSIIWYWTRYCLLSNSIMVWSRYYLLLNSVIWFELYIIWYWTPLSCSGHGDHPEWILMCDDCDAGWHASCLRPSLMVIPEGDWFCPDCSHR